MGVATFAELKPVIPGKRSYRPSSSIRHAVEWYTSSLSLNYTSQFGCLYFILNLLGHARPISDVSSDLIVEVDARSFSLHKFPLISRSGRIRKMLSEASDSKVSRITLTNVPGGSEAFELAAKFCYGVSIEITLSNVAMLKCVSHYLEMVEDFAEKNLDSQAETYMKNLVLPKITNSISVLHCCESLLPIAEEINIVSRIINGIACNASKEQLASGLSKLEKFPLIPMTTEPDTPPDWWGKSLTVLSLEFLQRVLSALKIKGLKQDMITKILINYAHKSLQGLVIRDPHITKGSFSDAELRKKQKVIVEAIVTLLPNQSRKCSVPISFLSGLLKTAILASASIVCKADLERRIGLHLDEAILEDILIPANSHHNNHHMLYDTDTISRIFTIFSNVEEEDDDENHMAIENEMDYDFDIPVSPKHGSILKAHPNVKDSERYRLCKTIDCQKLSQEACSHAAQNERLPMQMAVQVLYIEQMRLRNAMNGGHNQFFGSIHGQFPQRSNSAAGSGAISPRDNYASVRRENRELKLEVARMRMRLTELEKDHVSMKQELVRSNPTNTLLRSFTKKLKKLNSLFHVKDDKPISSSSDTWFLFQKKRRHSLS
ncbi:BTB/POZ domain-containing protein [Thalictrum thalictroides]|uniref:BTB/POZ domain-containing protein n=1 Tax=Thalictrum thalictroides TaxID=46969 RepID=A0A7J6XAC8_THATH|nr:BTB/POZ domain-containing protein [Thalictrum thalictroides]